MPQRIKFSFLFEFGSVKWPSPNGHFKIDIIAFEAFLPVGKVLTAVQTTELHAWQAENTPLLPRMTYNSRQGVNKIEICQIHGENLVSRYSKLKKKLGISGKHNLGH